MRKLTVVFVLLAGMAIAPAAFAAPVSTGHSGWAWGNPTPQGNTVRGLEFSGNRGYAAGDFGTVLRTDDGGATWSGIQTGITPDLAGVRILGSPDSIVIGGGCTARRSDTGGANFTRLPFTSSDLNCPTQLTSFSFPSSSVGYLLLSDGSVRSTSDGGQTFGSRVGVPGTRATGASNPVNANDIAFTSPTTGFAVTGPTGDSGGGSIYRTTDGGGSWTLVKSLPQGVNGVTFPTPSAGFAVGNSNLVSTTTDGGATWSDPRPVPGGARKLISARCASATLCLVTNANGAGLLRTADGGASFSEVTPSDRSIFAAAFASPTRAVAAGKDGVTVVSDDGGVNWRPIGSRLTGSFFALTSASSSTAFAFGDNGALARTTDGGGTWANVGVPTSGRIVSVSFPSSTVGFALDDSGQLQRTDNGGSSWSLLTTVAATRVFALSPGRLLLVGPRGIRRSTNGGQEFRTVGGRAVSRAALGHAQVVGSALFAWSARVILLSTNGGTSWRSVRRPSGSNLRSLDFVNRTTGFAVDVAGRVFSTRNGGHRWTQVVGVGASLPLDVDFATSRAGFLSVTGFDNQAGGWVLRTSDGGGTWRPQLLLKGSIQSISSPASGAGLALAGGGNLFTTASGGDHGTTSRLTLSARPRRLRKAGAVTVSGRLRPPEGRELVAVAKLERGRWSEKTVQVASNGSFTTSWTVGRTAIFVAQWGGDDDRNSAGSVPLTVLVKK